MVEQIGYRRAFDERLGAIDGQVARMFGLVAEAVAAATGALLRGDREAAQAVADQDAAVDRLEREIEELAQRELLSQSPMARDLRFLLSVVRITPELERSGDLATHIANRALDDLAGRLPEPVRAALEEMGALCTRMWEAAGAAWRERDAGAAARIDREDDRIDELHDRLVVDLCQGGGALDDALQATLVARFFERLGDHAVHVSERIAYLAGV
jgi:phosphate transport system protein